MKAIKYTITLLSDAEPGTGVGGELVNQRIPRDELDRPVIPANHLKGLLREELMTMELISGLEGLADRVLGQPDGARSETIQKNESICRFSDAKIDGTLTPATTDYVTRTAIDTMLGKARNGSLRTTERIAAGTVFHGKIILAGDGTSQEELAVYVALMAMGAIGGGRNRGMGKVVVAIKEESRQPGDIFKALFKADPFNKAYPFKLKESSVSNDPESRKTFTPDETFTTLRLTFTAEEPLCCPEKPIVIGSIESGFAISPSAVRGWMISRMAKEHGDSLATEMFMSKEFRVWPLLPCGFPEDIPEDIPDAAFVPIRVSVTHKTAKLVLEGSVLNAGEVEDKPIAEVGETPSNNPLKASDGVLLYNTNTTDKKVRLWKSGSMPRVASAHGVHNDCNTEDGRNLYQTVSMAPLVWSGVVTIPKNWADLLIASVEKDDHASFGRFRSTRGLGRIKLVRCNDDNTGLPWSQTDYDDILILQSPIWFDNKPNNNPDGKKTANQEFEEFIKDKWKELFEDGLLDVRAISTNIGVRFGWNRNQKGRQQACRVALPGSVFRIYKKGLLEEECRGEQHESSRNVLRTKDNIFRRLIRSGLGKGVERGFGAVSVHPGMASEVFQPVNSTTVSTCQSDSAHVVQMILNLWQKHKNNMPSVSQISAVAERAIQDRRAAVAYLNSQLRRLENIWATWKDIKDEIEVLLNDDMTYDSAAVQTGLKLLTDLVKYDNARIR